jgi:hypothetical protein
VHAPYRIWFGTLVVSLDNLDALIKELLLSSDNQHNSQALKAMYAFSVHFLPNNVAILMERRE